METRRRAKKEGGPAAAEAGVCAGGGLAGPGLSSAMPGAGREVRRGRRARGLRAEMMRNAAGG